MTAWTTPGFRGSSPHATSRTPPTDRLAGLSFGSRELDYYIDTLRAEMLPSINLILDAPAHGHPHVITHVLVVDAAKVGPGRAGEVRLLPTYDDCPDDA